MIQQAEVHVTGKEVIYATLRDGPLNKVIKYN